jgi:hypothetical protein
VTGASSWVLLGAPRQSERFPGDPTARRLPRAPRAPETDDQAAVRDRAEPVLSAADAAIEKSLPEGKINLPVSGYIYFAHKGKTKSIKSLELLYNGPAGQAELKLK